MPSEDERDFPSFASAQQLSPRERYELLLRAVRYLLARQVSFTQIEDALVAGGIAPGAAERLVELVIQDLEGVRRPPTLYSETDVPANALEALGFVADTRHVPAGSLFAIALGTDPAPAFAFVSAPAAARAARTRHRGASVKRLLMTAAVVLAVLAALALVLF